MKKTPPRPMRKRKSLNRLHGVGWGGICGFIRHDDGRGHDERLADVLDDIHN